MAKLERIANVQIDLRTTAIKELSFSDMIILGAHVVGTTRTLIITDASDLLDLGIAETDPLYFAARDAFSGIPSVSQVYIGRRQVNTVNLSITGTVVEGTAYGVNLSWKDANGVTQNASPSYTAATGDDASDVATGLSAAINATAVTATATPTTNAIALVNDVAGTPLSVSVAQGNVVIAQPTSTETPTEALTAALQEGNNWYGVVLADRDEDAVKDVMAWAETNEKLFVTSSSNPAMLDPGDDTHILAYAQQHQYFRTVVRYSANAATEFPEATWMSEMFTFYPGTETWALQKLPGITVDNLTEGQAKAVLDKNGNTFEMFRNFAVTQGGKVAAGEWVDVIRFRDYLVDAVKVSVVSKMVNAKGKVPFTDPGIQIIGNGIREPLDLNVSRGGIAPEELDADGNIIPPYTISLPLSANVPFNDKANRVLNDVKFTARLSGAIHVVNIKGTLSYQL